MAVQCNEQYKKCPVNVYVQAVSSSSNNFHVGTGSRVALQTARVVLWDERLARTRVLFDA